MAMLIYAVLQTKPGSGNLNTIPEDIKGIREELVYAVPFKEITAVVGNINETNVIPDKLDVIAYAGVIEKLLQKYTLLPMRFGSKMESNEAIKNMLENNYTEFQKNLQKVENKVEFGLKIFCDAEKLKQDLLKKSEVKEVSPPHKSIESKNSVFTDYINKKLKEHRYEEMLLRYVETVITEITDCLSSLSTDSRFTKMTSAKQLIDSVFLLEKEKDPLLIENIQTLQKKHPGLNFILTGPWPPYSFVELTLK